MNGPQPHPNPTPTPATYIYQKKADSRPELGGVLVQLPHEVEGPLHVVGHGLQPLEEVLFGVGWVDG